MCRRSLRSLDTNYDCVTENFSISRMDWILLAEWCVWYAESKSEWEKNTVDVHVIVAPFVHSIHGQILVKSARVHPSLYLYLLCTEKFLRTLTFSIHSGESFTSMKAKNLHKYQNYWGFSFSLNWKSPHSARCVQSTHDEMSFHFNISHTTISTNIYTYTHSFVSNTKLTIRRALYG